MVRDLRAGFVVSIFAAMILANASAEQPLSRPGPAELLQAKSPLVIAHRGASAVAPENTAASFREALAADSDLVELDYYVASDGTHVVLHDATLDRTTNACALWGAKKIGVVGKTWDDLKALDAGTWFAAKFAGEPLPRLDDSLDLIQTGSLTLIERKGGDAQALVDLLREKHLVDRVAVQAFDWKYVADVARLEPGVALGALGSKAVDADKLKQLAAIDGIDFVGWSHQNLDAAAIEAFHAQGRKVFAYTVNDVARAKELVALGVDGIITDDPRTIRATLGVGER